MTSRDRRALIAGAAIMVIAVLGLRAGPWGWRRSQERIEHLRAQAALLTRMREELGRANALEDSATKVKRRLLALAPTLLAARTTAEATAALTEQLAVVAGRARVRLDRTEATPDSSTNSGLHRVTVRTAIEGDTRGTLGFVGALATTPVVLVLDELRIVAPNPGSAGTTPEVLRTELTVHGWYLPSGMHP